MTTMSSHVPFFSLFPPFWVVEKRVLLPIIYSGFRRREKEDYSLCVCVFIFAAWENGADLGSL